MANKEESIKTKIELSGEREYKQSCSDLTKNLSVLSSQMRLTKNQFGDNATSMDALKAKSSILNSQVDEQTKKVDTLSAALAKSKQVYGENSAKAKDWEIKLNSAKIALNNSKSALDEFNSKNKGLIDLNNATEKFKNSVSNLAAKSKTLSSIGTVFDNAKKKIGETSEKLKPMNDLMSKAKTGAGAVGAGFKAMGEKLSEVGAKIAPVAKGLADISKVSFKAVAGTIDVAAKSLVAFGAAGAAAGTAIFAMTAKAGAAADDINTLAKVSGLSTEQLQKFEFASDLIDVSMDTLTGSMSKLTKNMGNAKNGSKSAQEAFTSLGVSFKDNVTGELRDNEDVFNDAIAALGKIENSTERDAMAMELFGKSAQDLNPLIMGGSDALKELGSQAENAGLILGQDSLDKLNSFNDSIDTFKSTTKLAGRVFSVGFAEPLAAGMTSINSFIMDATKAFQQNGLQGVIGEVEKAIPRLAESITTKLPEIITSFSTNLSSILTTVAGTIPTLLNSLLPPLIEGVTQLVNGLVAMFPTLLPVIVDAAFTLFLGLIDGINEVLPQLIEVIPSIIENVSNTLIENLPLIIEGGIQILVSLIEGITTTIPTLIEKVIELIPVITKALMDNLPLIIEAGMKLLLAVTQGIIAAIPQLIQALPQVISSIVSGLLNSLPVILDVGKDIVKGLWEGICSMGGWLMDAVGGFFGGIVDGVKDFLGIHSPSTVFAEVGNNMAAGVGVGFGDEMDTVSSDMQNAIPTSFEMNANIEGQGIVMPDLTPAANQSAVNAMNVLIESLKTGSTRLTEATTTIITAIVNGLTAGQPQIETQGINLDKSLATGLVKGITLITEKINQLITSITNTFQASGEKFVAIGKNIMYGIGDGITSSSGWLNDLINRYIDDMVASVEDKLEIHSPSRVFAGIGRYMAKGLGVGFGDEMKTVSNLIRNSIPTKAPRMAYAGNGRIERTDGATAGSVVVNQHIYAPVGDYIAQQKAARKQFQQIARDL